jgi:23S rRNA (pseudouridine1915-N3)-methyltransferase
VRLTILCVGRVKAAPELELCDLYCERARVIGTKLGFSKLNVVSIETSRAATPELRMNDEAAKLSAKLPRGAHRFALDEAGRAMTSEAFARKLGKLRDSGTGDLAFLIGGPDGLAAPLRDSAEERLALGVQTWPHLLVRAMLAEQIYRAVAILSGHPYHRGRSS